MPDANGKLTPQEQAELADLAVALAHNPETRGVVAEAVRKIGAKDKRVAGFVASFDDVNPAMPKVADDPKKKPLPAGDLDERFAAEEGKRRVASDKAQRAATRQMLLDSQRFTETSMTKLEEFMEANGYENYEHAAILYAHENPPTVRPQTGASHGWQMPAGDVLKDPRKTALDKAYVVVDEIRRARA